MAVLSTWNLLSLLILMLNFGFLAASSPWDDMCDVYSGSFYAGTNYYQFSSCDDDTLPSGSYSGYDHSNTSIYFSNSNIKTVSSQAFAGYTAYNIVFQTTFTTFAEEAFDQLTVEYLQIILNRNLLSLPSQLFAGILNVKVLIIRDNALTSLASGIFQGLNNLNYLDLSFNYLVSLPGDIFQGLNLNNLFLNNNHLESLPAEIFQGLNNLVKLHLYSNEISFLAGTIFSGLGSLEQLYLDSNKIVCFAYDLFQSLDGLQTLKIGQDVFNVGVCSQSFKGISASVRCSGDHCPVNQYCAKACSPGSSISWINDAGASCDCDRKDWCFNADCSSIAALGFMCSHSSDKHNINHAYSHCGLDYLPSGNYPGEGTRQYTIKFQNSRIRHVRSHAFSGYTIGFLHLENSFVSFENESFARLSVENLLIRENSGLTSLPSRLFAAMTKIYHIVIHKNNLNTLPSRFFLGRTDILSLGLTNNGLQSLPADVFQGLSNLDSLDLANNHLTALDRNTFDGLGRLKNLNLGWNRIGCFAYDLFQDLLALETLNIQQTVANSGLCAQSFKGIGAYLSCHGSSYCQANNYCAIECSGGSSFSWTTNEANNCNCESMAGCRNADCSVAVNP